jgi:hypothetical protein
MAVTATPVFVQTPKVTRTTFTSADTTTAKTIATAGTNGSKVTAVSICSDDTSDRVFQLGITRSATFILLGSVNLKTLAGTDGATAAVNGFNLIPGLPVDSDGQKYFFMESGDTLQAKTTTTITAAKTVSVTAVQGDF